MLTFQEIQDNVYATAKEKGFWSESLYNGATDLAIIQSKLMLTLSEIGEAVEAIRHEDPKGLALEMADVFIRILDLRGYLCEGRDFPFLILRSTITEQTDAIRSTLDAEVAKDITRFGVTSTNVYFLNYLREIAAAIVFAWAGISVGVDQRDLVAFKLEGVLHEVIRFCCKTCLDLEKAIVEKALYNKSRPYMHGKKI